MIESFEIESQLHTAFFIIIILFILFYGVMLFWDSCDLKQILNIKNFKYRKSSIHDNINFLLAAAFDPEGGSFYMPVRVVQKEYSEQLEQVSLHESNSTVPEDDIECNSLQYNSYQEDERLKISYDSGNTKSLGYQRGLTTMLRELSIPEVLEIGSSDSETSLSLSDESITYDVYSAKSYNSPCKYSPHTPSPLHKAKKTSFFDEKDDNENALHYSVSTSSIDTFDSIKHPVKGFGEQKQYSPLRSSTSPPSSSSPATGKKKSAHPPLGTHSCSLYNIKSMASFSNKPLVKRKDSNCGPESGGNDIGGGGVEETGEDTTPFVNQRSSLLHADSTRQNSFRSSLSPDNDVSYINALLDYLNNSKYIAALCRHHKLLCVFTFSSYEYPRSIRFLKLIFEWIVSLTCLLLVLAYFNNISIFFYANKSAIIISAGHMCVDYDRTSREMCESMTNDESDLLYQKTVINNILLFVFQTNNLASSKDIVWNANRLCQYNDNLNICESTNVVTYMSSVLSTIFAPSTFGLHSRIAEEDSLWYHHSALMLLYVYILLLTTLLSAIPHIMLQYMISFLANKVPYIHQSYRRYMIAWYEKIQQETQQAGTDKARGVESIRRKRFHWTSMRSLTLSKSFTKNGVQGDDMEVEHKSGFELNTRSLGLNKSNTTDILVKDKHTTRRRADHGRVNTEKSTNVVNKYSYFDVIDTTQEVRVVYSNCREFLIYLNENMIPSNQYLSEEHNIQSSMLSHIGTQHAILKYFNISSNGNVVHKYSSEHFLSSLICVRNSNHDVLEKMLNEVKSKSCRIVADMKRYVPFDIKPRSLFEDVYSYEATSNSVNTNVNYRSHDMYLTTKTIDALSTSDYHKYVNEFRDLENKISMQVELLRHFILEQFPVRSIHHFGLSQALLGGYAYNTYAAKYISTFSWIGLWIVLWSILVLLSGGIYLLLTDALVLHTNQARDVSKHDSRSYYFAHIFIILFIHFSIDMIFIQMSQIYVLHILIIPSALPRLQHIYCVLNNCINTLQSTSVHSIRTDLLRDFIHVFQHVSAACRASRNLLFQNSAVANLFLVVDDYDDYVLKTGVVGGEKDISTSVWWSAMERVIIIVYSVMPDFLTTQYVLDAILLLTALVMIYLHIILIVYNIWILVAFYICVFCYACNIVFNRFRISCEYVVTPSFVTGDEAILTQSMVLNAGAMIDLLAEKYNDRRFQRSQMKPIALPYFVKFCIPDRFHSSVSGFLTYWILYQEERIYEEERERLMKYKHNVISHKSSLLEKAIKHIIPVAQEKFEFDGEFDIRVVLDSNYSSNQSSTFSSDSCCRNSDYDINTNDNVDFYNHLTWRNMNLPVFLSSASTASSLKEYNSCSMSFKENLRIAVPTSIPRSIERKKSSVSQWQTIPSSIHDMRVACDVDDINHDLVTHASRKDTRNVRLLTNAIDNTKVVERKSIRKEEVGRKKTKRAERASPPPSNYTNMNGRSNLNILPASALKTFHFPYMDVDMDMESVVDHNASLRTMTKLRKCYKSEFHLTSDLDVACFRSKRLFKQYVIMRIDGTDREITQTHVDRSDESKSRLISRIPGHCYGEEDSGKIAATIDSRDHKNKSINESTNELKKEYHSIEEDVDMELGEEMPYLLDEESAESILDMVIASYHPLYVPLTPEERDYLYAEFNAFLDICVEKYMRIPESMRVYDERDRLMCVTLDDYMVWFIQTMRCIIQVMRSHPPSPVGSQTMTLVTGSETVSKIDPPPLSRNHIENQLQDEFNHTSCNLLKKWKQKVKNRQSIIKHKTEVAALVSNMVEVRQQVHSSIVTPSHPVCDISMTSNRQKSISHSYSDFYRDPHSQVLAYGSSKSYSFDGSNSDAT